MFIAAVTALCCFPVSVLASTDAGATINLTHSTVGYMTLIIFVVAYLVVMSEEFTHLRKSKPVILAAGMI